LVPAGNGGVSRVGKSGDDAGQENVDQGIKSKTAAPPHMIFHLDVKSPQTDPYLPLVSAFL
jgi:hypothetical protein